MIDTFKCECGNNEFIPSNLKRALGYDKQVIECTKCSKQYKLPIVILHK